MTQAAHQLQERSSPPAGTCHRTWAIRTPRKDCHPSPHVFKTKNIVLHCLQGNKRRQHSLKQIQPSGPKSTQFNFAPVAATSSPYSFLHMARIESDEQNFLGVHTICKLPKWQKNMRQLRICNAAQKDTQLLPNSFALPKPMQKAVVLPWFPCASCATTSGP